MIKITYDINTVSHSILVLKYSMKEFLLTNAIKIYACAHGSLTPPLLIPQSIKRYFNNIVTYNHPSYNPLILRSHIRSTTYLLKSASRHVFTRSMMSSRCMHAMRALYHATSIISNTDTINHFNKDNPKPLINEIVRYTLNDAQGISQHKTAIFKHLSNQQFQGELFYESFIDQTNNQIVKYEPYVLADFRTLNELNSLDLLIKHYGKDMAWVYATLDQRSATFPHAHQTNPDFWIFIDNMLGLKSNRVTYHDDKSGMDMFKHSSKGSLGVVSYDASGKNIQMTSNPIEIKDLIVYNKKKILKLEMALMNDNLGNLQSMKEVIKDAQIIQEKMVGKMFEEVSELHNKLQTFLWKEIQCHPNFSQSVSFIFLKQIINQPFTDQEIKFSKLFQSKLHSNKLYNLTKQGDVKEFYKAFIYAGKEMDPQFIQKLHYLHNNGMTLNTSILSILSELAKNGLY